jgi:hypothetical protein
MTVLVLLWMAANQIFMLEIQPPFPDHESCFTQGRGWESPGIMGEDRDRRRSFVCIDVAATGQVPTVLRSKKRSNVNHK